MKLARPLVRTLLVFLLTPLGFGCASSGADAETSDDALTGSPNEERVNRDVANEKAYLSHFDQAYVNAELGAFTTLADGNGLVGQAAADFRTLSTNCAGRAGFTVHAQRWAANDIPRPISGGFSLETRNLFTIDAFDAHTKTTLAVAVYDEDGAFLFGRKRSQSGYTTQRGSEFRKSVSSCT